MRTELEKLREIIQAKADELDADFNQYQAGAKNILIDVLFIIDDLILKEKI
jgi:hypothetical protein